MENVFTVLELPEDIISGFEHIDNLLAGYESLVTRESLNPFESSQSGLESYARGVLLCYNVDGMEEGFWDKVAKTGKAVAESIKNQLKKFKDYFFNGDGAKQIEQADKSSEEVIKKLKDMDGNIPIPDGHALRDPSKYYKEVKLEGVEQELQNKINSAADKLKSSCEGVKSCSTLGALVSVYEKIRADSLAAAKLTTESLKTTIDEAEKATNEISNPKAPLASEPAEVQQAKKEEYNGESNKAKEKAKGARSLAGIRNTLLSSSLVLGKNVGAIEKLSNNKEFKG